MTVPCYFGHLTRDPKLTTLPIQNPYSRLIETLLEILIDAFKELPMWLHRVQDRHRLAAVTHLL